MVRVKVDEAKKEMTIVIDMQPPTPSGSGKTLVVASTHGNAVTDCEIGGKQVVVGVNAYIKK